MLLSLLLIIPVYSFTQHVPASFGTISIDELRQDSFGNDTSAAVILFDKGDVEMETNSTIATIFRRHMRLKILKSSALSDWAKFSFDYPKDAQIKIKGLSYNLENGMIQKTELSEQSIYRGKSNSKTESIRLAFPNVKVGTVYEFSFVAKFPDLMDFSWKFQYGIPVRLSEYTISLPVQKLAYYITGDIKPAAHVEKNKGQYHQWVMKDLPAFVAEPKMPRGKLYASAVYFAFRYTSWEGFYHILNRSNGFGQVIHQHKYLQKTVDQLTGSMVDDWEKVKAISGYVKTHVKFNGDRDYFADEPSKVLAKESGSAADINLLLASMLEKAGLKVSTVLLSTRDHGFVMRELPTSWQFDYVVCSVATKDGDLLLDATDPVLPYDQLPPRCFNHIGFLVAPGQYGWIGIEPKHKKKITMDVAISISESGDLTGNLKSYKDGYAAYETRKQYDSAHGKQYEIRLDNKHCLVSNPAHANMNSLDKPVEETCQIAIDDFATTAGDLMYFNPHIFFRQEANPFVTNERLYPIDLGELTEQTIVYTIKLPSGFKLEEVPKNKAMIMPDGAGKCTLNFTQNGNSLIIVSKLQINKTLFEPREYPTLKEFYSKVVAYESELIVLRRI